MATCENCSTVFNPDPNATEVTSTRILCAKCEAERRAEKQRRAAAASAASGSTRPASASMARTGAPPVPAAKRPATGSAAPASSAARPAATPASAKSPASGIRPAAARSENPPAARSQPASTRATRPDVDEEPPATAKARSGKKVARVPSDIHREAELIKNQQNRVIMYGWIACGVLLLIAGVVVFLVVGTKTREADAIRARQEAVASFLERVKRFDVGNEAQAAEAVKVIEGDKDKWEEEKTASEVAGILAKAKANISRIAEARELQDRLTNAEQIARDAGNARLDDLSRLRRNMEDLEAKGEMVGPEFKARVAILRTNLDRAYVTKLHDEAKALAGKGREGLAAYTKAEEESLKLFEHAFKRKNEEQRVFFEKHLKEIYAESDALVAQVFTPEVIDKTPWTDLLSGEMTKQWQNDGLKGWRIEAGQLHAVGPEPGATKEGLMAVPMAGGWRDFQLQMEFVIVKGNVDFRFRLGRRVDFTAESYAIATTAKDAAFKAGETYNATATMLGSNFSVKFEQSDITEFVDELRFNMQRKGAFGVIMSDGSEIKFTKLKLRDLR